MTAMERIGSKVGMALLLIFVLGGILKRSGSASASGSQMAAPVPEVGDASHTRGPGGELPNIIFILIDDERTLEMDLGFGRSLPGWDSALDSELIKKGVTFENFFNSTPLCCPARANYLTGMYSHNNGIWANNYSLSGGNGGWRRYWELEYENASMGRWMQDAGYTTVLVGKFLNGFPNTTVNILGEDYIPTGWNEWYSSFLHDKDLSYYQFRFNENGTIVEYGGDEPAYLTDVEHAHAVDFIDRIASTGQPFFMYLAPFAPHGPIQEAPRHVGFHVGTVAATPPSFNEEDVSDKPLYVQELDPPFPVFWNEDWNRRLDMTLALDEMIRGVIDALEEHGLLDTTYIFFTNDNGLVFGEHRLSGKGLPYEEVIRFPLIVRGPGVGEDLTSHNLVANIDLAPTFLELAGAVPPPTVDGESLVGLMTGDPSDLEDWRDGVLVELNLAGPTRDPGDYGPAKAGHTVPAWVGVRTLGHIYLDYESGDQELYDLMADPYQLESFHDSAPPELLDELQVLLDALKECSGAPCAEAARLGAPNARPKALFSATCRDDLSCLFVGTSSFDLDGEIILYTWNFGDGATGEGPSSNHTYGAPGNYPVTLTVKDDVGDTGVLTQVIDVGSEIFSDGFETGDTSLWSQ